MIPVTDITTMKANSHLTFDDHVLEKIAGICARDVDGLLEMDGNVIDSLTETLGKDASITKGISAEVDEHVVTIDMNAIVAYNTDTQALFDTLCDRIYQAVTHMTGLELTALNLHVQDVLTRKEWKNQTKAK